VHVPSSPQNPLVVFARKNLTRFPLRRTSPSCQSKLDTAKIWRKITNRKQRSSARRTCYLRTPLVGAILGLDAERESYKCRRRETWRAVAARDVARSGGGWRRSWYDGQLYRGVIFGRSSGGQMGGAGFWRDNTIECAGPTGQLDCTSQVKTRDGPVVNTE